MKFSDTALTIVIEFMFIAVYLTIFFFFYVKNVEKKIVQTQIVNVIKDIEQEITPFNLIPGIPLNIGKPPDLSVVDQKARSLQKKVFQKAIAFLAKFLIGIWGIITVLTFFYGISFTEVMVTSIIGVGAVALVEYLFLTFFVSNYVTLDENMVKSAVTKGILNAINKYENS